MRNSKTYVYRNGVVEIRGEVNYKKLKVATRRFLKKVEEERS